MKKLLVICGATASGKTALAVECAKRLGGEVVSCDALLVYRGLNIGTAKPTKEERAGIPHHLIDVADPTDPFTVHDYERLALAAIEDALAAIQLLPELYAEDIRRAWEALGVISGETANEAVINEIFAKFCVGK